ncbi:MAG TPA: ATP-binding protein [Casimicrobiaceae bacterium]|jgi:two-component system sensor kinase FixL|nr:ATP-binding protein [Casimicrobiaceae bacterium]
MDTKTTTATTDGKAPRISSQAANRNGSEFHRLLDVLPAGAYTCDADGLITYFNQHAVALWGRTPALNDASDRFCGSFKLYSKDGAPIAHDQCWMALALRERKEYNGQEIIVERPDGVRATTLAHANPFIDSEGRLLGAVNVLVDISARKRAEEALREAHDRLAEKVIARTVELTELSHHLFQVAESERAKLASELHDDMGSLLTVLSMRLGRLKEQLQEAAPELVDEQQELIDLLHATVGAQRRIVASLRPVLLDSFGLVVALRNHIEDWSKNSRISAEVDLPSQLPQLHAEAALTLFRITQESLTNAAKHARASRVRVSVRIAGKEIGLRIDDNGKGIAPEQLRHPSSHGIMGMRERLLQFGGQLSVEPGAQGRGTRVCASMPISATT